VIVDDHIICGKGDSFLRVDPRILIVSCDD
jgi:hypothetical protein